MCGKTVYVIHFSVFILDDDNRIVLQPIDGHPDCQHEYINASYIDVREFCSCTCHMCVI